MAYQNGTLKAISFLEGLQRLVSPSELEGCSSGDSYLFQLAYLFFAENRQILDNDSELS